jgi:hypothetical protein
MITRKNFHLQGNHYHLTVAATIIFPFLGLHEEYCHTVQWAMTLKDAA